MGIQCCHNLILLHTQILEAVLLCRGTKISLLCHDDYELQKGFRIGWDIAGLDQRQIEKVIRKPWAVDGKNFSERVWGNKEKLITEVHRELTQDILLGRDPQKAIDNIARKILEAVLLCRGTKISLLCHDEAACVVF